MHSAGTASELDAGAGSPTPADEAVACRCAARLLITASTDRGAETLARRIHGAGPRARRPFVRVRAGDLPVGPQALRDYCGRVLDRAAGGSVLIEAVEEMPTTVQDALIDLLAGLEFRRRPSAAVRLISGTTVSLLDHIVAGRFSEQLFYRLNIIHLIARDSPSYIARADDPQQVHVNEPLTPKLPR